MARYWPRFFMDFNSVTIHKHAKNELEQYPAILTSRSANVPCTYRYHFELILHLQVDCFVKKHLKNKQND